MVLVQFFCGPLVAGGQGLWRHLRRWSSWRVQPSMKNHLPLFEMLTDMASELMRASDMRRQLLASRGRIVAFQSLAGHDSGFHLGR